MKLFNFNIGSKAKPTSTPPADETNEQFNDRMRDIQDELIKAALDIGHNRGIELDFSNESVHHIDEILEGIRNSYIKNGIKTPDQIQNTRGAYGFATMFGHYLVACIERNHQAGHWTTYSKPVGRVETFAVDGFNLYPVAWCMKRLSIGPEEGIAFKYKVMMRQLADRK